MATEEYVTVTKNACKLCTPLGASLFFKGICGSIPLLHGSQGCSTYIRRYLISHFKEPVDIACSNFGEQTAIFGGEVNLKVAFDNIIRQYNPEFIGVATTCLSETIGDDVPMFIRKYKEANRDNKLPQLVYVSTASYRGTHIDGFHDSVKATVDILTSEYSYCKRENSINIFPGMLSPADLRYLKEIFNDFDVPFVMLPDYSQILDGSPWKEYQKFPKGGTKVENIINMGTAKACIEFGKILAEQNSAGKLLNKRYDMPCYNIGIPMGIHETDIFFNSIETITGKSTPEKYIEERGRLIDSYIDSHKYVMGVRAAVYGEEDMVVAIVSFLNEIGIIPVLCASGGKSGYFKDKIREMISDFDEKGIVVIDDSDFSHIETFAKQLKPDILIGSSKGYAISRSLKIPLIRVGFPIHDRINGSRILHIGYRGAQQLFDTIVNTLLEKRQESSVVGYSYM
ncbi:MAG: nitrogenase [Desulfobacterales bacterium]|nr:nitrogenase [Desulfobacterales bacterium]